MVIMVRRLPYNVGHRFLVLGFNTSHHFKITRSESCKIFRLTIHLARHTHQIKRAALRVAGAGRIAVGAVVGRLAFRFTILKGIIEWFANRALAGFFKF